MQGTLDALTYEEIAEIRAANLVREQRPCLRCRRPFLTDRCHRVCSRCARRNYTESLSYDIASSWGEAVEYLEKAASA